MQLKPDYSVDIKGSQYYMAIYSILPRLMDKYFIPDENYPIVRLQNNYLEYATCKQPTEEDYLICTNAADEIERFQKILAEKGIPVLFVLTPMKTHVSKSYTPRGFIPNASNSIGDMFLERLKEKHIKYYDARRLLANDPEKHYRLFFRGDHHWKPEYALLSFQDLLKSGNLLPHVPNWDSKLQSKQVDFPIATQFQVNKTGSYFISYEHTITHYYPSYPTDITVKMEGQKCNKRGRFEQLDLSNYYRKNPSLKIAINHKISKGKIIFIKDSFGLPWFDFLALNYHEVHMLDLRGSKDPAVDYVEQVKPELVIIAYSCSSLNNSLFNNFFHLTFPNSHVNPFFQ